MRLSLLLITSLLLSACFSSKETKNDPVEPLVTTVTKFVPYECGESPVRTKLSLSNVQWIVQPAQDEIVYFMLTPKGYEVLSKNTSDILIAIKELRVQVRFYEDCIFESKKSIDKRNAMD